MPTQQELSDLNSKCTWTWTTKNGVKGCEVRGRGDYAANSIFFPAAGDGYGTSLYDAGSDGCYWSSVPYSDDNYYAWYLGFYSSGLGTGTSGRSGGRSVRPVQGFAVTITFNANGGTVSPSSQSYAANGTYGSLPTATRAGYTFEGWFTAASGGKQVIISSMVPSSNATLYAHWTAYSKVQLWEGGPYWAETNIGAEAPEEYGYYFWWGDTVGYKRENDKWVASDGSSLDFSFDGSSTPTYDKSDDTLKNEGWITADDVLAPTHDAAHVHWGGDWRMPTRQELADLNSKCDWTWTTKNGVNGYEVRGKGTYAAASIFLPAAGYGNGTLLYYVGSDGGYWSSVPISVNYDFNYLAWYLYFYSSYHYPDDYYRYYGQSVRPVQGFTK